MTALLGWSQDGEGDGFPDHREMLPATGAHSDGPSRSRPPLPLGHTGSPLVVPRPSCRENQVKARLTQLHLVYPALCMSDSELRVINNNKGIISHTEMS